MTNWIKQREPVNLAKDWDLVPIVLPPTWRHDLEWEAELRKVNSLSFAFTKHGGNHGLRVLVSARIELDRQRWLHVSMSRADRVPSHADMLDVRRIFVPKAATAYQVFPPQDQYVNHHPYVLHLWCPIDKPVTPDFRDEGSI